MKLKSILFVTEKLIVGGVELSLLEWVKYLNPYAEITIAVLYRGGKLETEFLKYAKIVELSKEHEKFRYFLLRMIKTGHIRKTVRIIRNAIIGRMEKSYIKQCFYLIETLEELKEEFDYAVCYHKPTDVLVPYVAKRVKAKEKIIWFHTEVRETVMQDETFYQKLFQNYNKYVCVSEAVRKQVKTFLPDREGDIVTIYNFFDKEIIKKKSDFYETEFDKKNLNIVTVGRLSQEKGQDMAIEAANILKKSGRMFSWYFLGDGPTKEVLFKLIENKGLQDCVHLIGKKSNPYPYIKECDIYVQPSREEGFGMAVAEAKLLARPIIVTNFLTATEHINDGINGYIVGMNAKEIAFRVMNLMDQKEKRIVFSEELSNFHYPDDNIERMKEVFSL